MKRYEKDQINGNFYEVDENLSDERWERLQQFSAFGQEEDKSYKPYIYGSIFIISYLVAQFIRVLF